MLIWLLACSGPDAPLPESPVESPADSPAAQGEPLVFLVVHADPVAMSDMSCTRDGPWLRLVAFLDEVERRNAERDEAHRLSLMFTPNWARFMANEDCANAELASWIEQGHEIALHSHSQTHKFRDGYSNDSTWAQSDADDGTESLCADRPNCSVDDGLQQLRAAVQKAGADGTLSWARIGPEGNYADDGNSHSESCVGTGLPAEAECITREWTGDVARLENSTRAYEVEHCDRDAPEALFGSSGCVDWAESEDIYWIPHAPYRSESGELRVSLERVHGDLAAAPDGALVGVVIHPKTYSSDLTDRTFCDDDYEVLDHKAYIDALLDVVDGQAVELGSDVLAANPLGDCDCSSEDNPEAPTLSLEALAPSTSLTLSQVKEADGGSCP